LDTVRLGKTDTQISRIGLGCWQFSGGRGIAGQVWPDIGQDAADAVVAESLAGGITLFDTAEAYGGGASERALAHALKRAGKADGDVVVATKWFPALRRAAHIGRSIDERLRCLDGFSIDLYQVHSPGSFSSFEKQMDAMARLAHDEKIRHVGISNFSASGMERCARALEERGLVLASNQMRFSLVDRRIEKNGVLQAAKDLGVTIIAYSPLGQGVLTGRFHEDASAVRGLQRGRRMLLRRTSLEKTRPLIRALREVGDQVGATPAQVALAWTVRFHGDVVVAIPGASKPTQAQSNAGALRVALSDAQLDRLDHASAGF
jgi:aryl-alcohol dehydrogenase-like predicted oxidoreductase